ncbi:MAG: hypothetical protein GY929_00050 [Actinomycetia bacterium]|nr:hypothetical protein [Actinomycetes bacterium]
MMFDNSPVPKSTAGQAIRRHLPVAALAGAAIAVFVGLHAASAAIMVVAIGHLVVAAMAAGAARLQRETPK